MSFEQARRLFGVDNRERRYLSIQDLREFEDITDPRTVEDDSRTTVRGWAAENAVLAVALSLIATLTVFVLGYYAMQFAPGVVTNPWVQRGAVAVTLVVLAYRYGWRKHAGIVDRRDRLDLKVNGRVIPMVGKYLRTTGEADAFVPIKGFRTAGHRPRPYTLDDLSPVLADTAATGSDGSVPAAILLHPRYSEREDTDYGSVTVVDSGDLDLARSGGLAVLRTTIPPKDESKLNDLANQLEKTERERDHAETMAKKYRQQRNKALEMASEPLDDQMDRIMGWYVNLDLARSGRRTGGDEFRPNSIDMDDFKGTGFRPKVPAGQNNGSDMDEIMDEVEDEVTDDDD